MNLACSVEIERRIDKLPNKKSSGHDNLSNILLKHIIKTIMQGLFVPFAPRDPVIL